MGVVNGIPIYENINDLHRLTGSALRTENPLFHCFDMATANDLKVSSLPPHRVTFYTLALNFGTEKLEYVLNGEKFFRPKNFLVCVAPGQVVRWRKEGDWKGYCTFFKSEFLNFSPKMNFLKQFPFFNISQTNFFSLEEEDFNTLSFYFNQIISEQSQRLTFEREIIASIFQSILWRVRRISGYSSDPSSARYASAIITSQFQYMVNEHFLEWITVEEYAMALNITPNHLTQTIRAVTGRNAKGIINERRMEEAKYLLTYTDLDIAEIGFHLRFTASTHFTKFFKKETGHSPSEFRMVSS